MMEPVNRRILEQVLAESAEPVVVVRVDHSEWPVALSNRAFAAIGGENSDGRPFADVIEQIVGRELALEISEAVRSKQETSFPVEQGGREFLLVLKPLALPGEAGASFYAAFWRGGSGGASTAGSEVQHALLKAKRRIRDLSRDDPVTGLLNGRAFREVLEHGDCGRRIRARRLWCLRRRVWSARVRLLSAAGRSGHPALPAACE
jgi:hypothetical protein